MIQFTQNKEYLWRGYFYAVVIFILFSVRSIFFHQHMHTSQLMGVKIRISIIGTIYKKVSIVHILCINIISRNEQDCFRINYKI